MSPRSLYIHVPFCTRRCAYCDFAVEAVREPPVTEWVDAVTRELALLTNQQQWQSPLVLDTLYIGGGTPSLLGPGAMHRLRDALEPLVTLAGGAEWTCEANPESFTPELARDWRVAGVNRISLGAQTFDPGALRWMGRLHGPDGPRRAVASAREAGFDNLSIDLIFALPARLERDFAADLERLLELAPEHVSLYGLTAEAGTPLGRWVAEKREVMADEDRYAEEYLLACSTLRAAGFEHYEVSNFGRPGKRSRHNFVYWTGEPYVALGPGAHSYFPPRRYWNHRSWSAYRDVVLTGALPIAGEERIDEETRRLEEVWLGLRTSRGLPMPVSGSATGEIVARWVAADLARIDGERVLLTPNGWLLLDHLAGDLVEAMQASRRRPHPKLIDARQSLVQISGISNDPNR